MKSITGLALAATAMAAAFSACSENKTYNINGEVDEKYNDAPVLLISMNNGDTLAQTNIAEGAFTITDVVETPVLAQLRIGGRAAGNIILEPGTISFTAEGITGTPLNDQLNELNHKQADVYQRISEIPDSLENARELAEAIIEQYNAYQDSVMNANISNPVGAALLLEQAYDMELAELEAALQQNPSLASYSKLKDIVNKKEIEAETSVGHPYKDFEVEYNGQTVKLSDLMKPDRYTLVDFWASWCGPCRREMPVIKEILEQYGPKGLDVVGVAVWDEPEASLQAMEELDITWPVIINAQRIPTDLYGILGIPTIILIGPDGTILSRGLQDEELKAAVAQAMDN